MSDAWAKEGILWVAKTNSWMLDFAPNTDGTYDFRPDAIETTEVLRTLGGPRVRTR